MDYKIYTKIKSYFIKRKKSKGDFIQEDCNPTTVDILSHYYSENSLHEVEKTVKDL